MYLFQYAELFDKFDVTREGTVDWDKFASHMLLEFYEKDDIFFYFSTLNCLIRLT